MRVTNSEQTLARIFVNESVKWNHRPLWVAIAERLKSEHFAGATVFRASAGFGPHSVLHSPGLFRMASAMPLIIEIVDDDRAMNRLLPILDEMMPEGLVTFEKVRAIRYESGPHPDVAAAVAEDEEADASLGLS